MREIQDLTLFKERGTKGIEDLFEIRAKRFASRTGSPPDMIFLRATAVPLTPVFVKRVHARGDLRPSLLRYVTLKDAETAVLQEVDPYSLAWCPVIGGTRARFEKSRRYVDIELSDTGLLEYMASVECQPEERGWFSLIPMIEMICSAIISVDRFRTGAGAPNAETGLEVAIIVNQNFARVVPAGHGADDAFGNLGRGLHSFPRYSFAEIGEMPLVLNELIRDIANAAGVDFPSSLAIEMVTRI
jgi:hypothetical protein